MNLRERVLWTPFISDCQLLESPALPTTLQQLFNKTAFRLHVDPKNHSWVSPLPSPILRLTPPTPSLLTPTPSPPPFNVIYVQNFRSLWEYEGQLVYNSDSQLRGLLFWRALLLTAIMIIPVVVESSSSPPDTSLSPGVRDLTLTEDVPRSVPSVLDIIHVYLCGKIIHDVYTFFSSFEKESLFVPT